MNAKQLAAEVSSLQEVFLTNTERSAKLKQQRSRDLFPFAPDGYIVTDTDGIIKGANRAALQMLNIKAEFVIGKPLVAFVALADRRVFRTNLLDINHNQRELTWDTHLSPRHLPILPIQLHVSQIMQRNQVRRLQWLIRDTTPQRSLDGQQTDENQRLQILSRSLVEAQETERRKLARELHDEVGQLLTGLKFALEFSRDQRLVAHSKITQALSILDELLAKVRNLSLQLRPPTLDALGLIPTLQWHFERFSAQTNIAVHFTFHDVQRGLTPQLEITAYRVVQEALTNIARHAGVKEAFVRVWVSQQLLHIEIEDHGKGFDYQQTLREAQSSGLLGMQDRVLWVGGTFSLYSTLGAGTQIIVELRLEPVE